MTVRHVLAFAFLLFAAPVAAQEIPESWSDEWHRTDFSKIIVEPAEIVSGGPPKDGIPAIDAPIFVSVRDGDLPELEPVISLEIDGRARAYPIRYMLWHQIVNDRFGNRPVTITFCPLCNAAIVFEGTLEGRPITFGVSGKIRNSDMVMYDRQTESWWQQFTGEGIVGKRAGQELEKLPSKLESWALFRKQHPFGVVMVQPEGHQRAYGNNPYEGYDTVSKPWLYNGDDPPHDIPLMARVVVVGDRAWPMNRVVEAGKLTEDGVTLSWKPGQASALDSRLIAKGRDVGNLTVTGTDNEPLIHDVTFAFVFTVFEPDGRWMIGS